MTILMAIVLVGLVAVATLEVMIFRTEREKIEEEREDAERIRDLVLESERRTAEFVANRTEGLNASQERRFAELAAKEAENDARTLERLSAGLSAIREETGKGLNEATSILVKGMESGAENQRRTTQTLTENLLQIRTATAEKLAEIRKDMSEKLDASLNKRLDESFEKVSSQLSLLHKSLGELGEMSSGIESLNKTLSNVKTRGTWGEVMLGSLMENVLSPSQYERNAKPNPSSREVVEFAVKIPSKDEDGAFVYLPIDSKFPSDAYSALLEAGESGTPDDRKKAEKEFERRILDEAKKISEKYVHPPYTTDFAIMFLPAESIYAEAMRIDGLAQECQSKHRVIVASPSTTTALLNSLQVGFAAVAVSKKTSEIRKLLSAVKAQYEKLDSLVEKTRKQLDTASRSADELKKRTEIIRKKLVSAEDMTADDSERLLMDDSSAYELVAPDDEPGIMNS